MTRDRGFTLLEVLIAMAILAIALLVVIRAQNQGMLVSRYQEQQITAATLARMKMTEVELELEKNGFPGDEKESCGKFDEELEEKAFEGYEYCWTLKKVELPLPMDEGGQGGEGGAAGGAAGGGQAAGAGALGLDPKAAGEQLSKAVRALKLTIKWKFGTVEQQLPVVTHLVNTTQTQVIP